MRKNQLLKTRLNILVYEFLRLANLSRFEFGTDCDSFNPEKPHVFKIVFILFIYSDLIFLAYEIESDTVK